jgi:hypothetical protein
MASNLEKCLYSPAGEAVSRPTCIQQFKTRLVKAILVVACCLGIWFHTCIPADVSPDLENLRNLLYRPNKLLCPQVNVLAPDAHRGLWDMVNTEISSPEFHAKAVDWLAGAVRIA